MSKHIPETDSDDEGDNFGEIYFKIQSELDFTKHVGALDATDEIRDLCQIGPGSRVLDVGCGVGMTAAYLAKTIGCHVTGIDLREGMIARSNVRAEREGVTDKVSFRVADAAALPFDDDAFDMVMCEATSWPWPTNPHSEQEILGPKSARSACPSCDFGSDCQHPHSAHTGNGYAQRRATARLC